MRKLQKVKINTSVLGFTCLSPDIWYTARVEEDHFLVRTPQGLLRVNNDQCTEVRDLKDFSV